MVANTRYPDVAVPQIYSPRDRLHMRGMFREPVGGVGVQANPGLTAGPGVATPGSFNATGGIIQPRGQSQAVYVTNVSQLLLPFDPSRKFLYMLNNDALGVVWVFFGGSGAVVGQGMRLGPAGGGILLDNHVPTAQVFMIGTIAVNPNVTLTVA
jgi:hypothetical protein